MDILVHPIKDFHLETLTDHLIQRLLSSMVCLLSPLPYQEYSIISALDFLHRQQSQKIDFSYDYKAFSSSFSTYTICMTRPLDHFLPCYNFQVRNRNYHIFVECLTLVLYSESYQEILSLLHSCLYILDTKQIEHHSYLAV